MGKAKFYAVRDDSGKTNKLFTVTKGKKDINVTFSVNDNGKKQDIFTYIVKPDTPPTPTNFPPVSKIVTQSEADAGTDVPLDGTGSSDQDGTIAKYEWSGDASIVDTAASTTSFRFPETGTESVAIRLIVTDDKGATGTSTATIVKKGLPPTPPPTPDPTGLPDLSKGTVLFDSNVVWNDGHDRTMTGHHEFDKYDPKTECAAGGHGTPRVWHVDGKGNSELSGGMSRVYNHSPHQGTICLLQTFIFDKSLDNFSLEIFSRHNEGGAESNRTGGLQNHLKTNAVGGKYESYHASYHDLGEKPYPNNKKINYGDEVRFALVAKKDGINYEETMFIDWDHNGKYTSVYNAKYTEKENPAGAALQPLYWRWRVNGNAPTKIKTWDVKFIQL